MKQMTVLFLSCLALNVGLFSKDIYIPSLPDMAADMHVSAFMMSQSLTVFIIGMGVSQIVFGCLSDHLGRKRVMLAGLSICLLGNVISVFAYSFNILIISRFMAGCGAGVCPVISRTMVGDVYEGSELTKSLSYLSMATVISPALAPMLGGLIQDTVDWHYNFIIISLCNFICLLLFEVIYIEENHLPISLQLNVKNIIRDHAIILKSATFQRYTAISIVAFSSGTIYLVMTPFMFQNGLGMSAFSNGKWYIWIAIGYLSGAFLASKLVDIINEDNIIRLGLFSCLSGALIMLVSYLYFGFNALSISLSMLINIIGCGLITPVANKLCLVEFDGRSGTAAAILGSGRMFGAYVISAIVLSAGNFNPLILGCALVFLAIAGLIF